MSIYVAIPLHAKVPKTDFGNVHYFEDVPEDSAAKKYNRIIEAFLASGEDWLNIHHSDLEIRCEEREIERQLEELKALDVHVAGLIGTLCLFNSLTWWTPGRPACTAGAIIQGFEGGKEQPMLDYPGMRTDLASVDGCCLWMSRQVLAEGLRLDEGISGWDLYDVYLCVECLRMGHKVGILNVCAKHDSEGDYDLKEFEVNRKYLLDKWSNIDFPIVSGVTKF